MSNVSRAALVLLAFGFAAAAPAQDATAPAALTLRQAADEALAGNPAIAASTARAGMAKARRLEARSMWLPRIDASQSVMRGNNPVFVFGSLLEQGRFGAEHFDPSFLNNPDPLTNYRLALNVRYPLFDQFRRFNVNRQAEKAVAQADAGSEEARQRIVAETIARYYGVVLAEQKRDVAADSVEVAESNARAMRDRFEQGVLVEAELLAAEVQLASFHQRLIEAEGEIAIARAALATMVQRHAATTVADATLPQKVFDVPALDTSLESGLAKRGDLRIATSGVELASLDLQSARGSLLPRVDTMASWGASGSKLSERNSDRTYGIVIGIDLFDGSRYARIASARAGVDAARAEAAMTRDRVRMEIIAAHHRAVAAREKVVVATRSVERADAAARMIQDRYENGLTTITEQLRAQTALVGAKLELLAARYDYVTGQAELMRATGGLTDVDPFL